ncbi:MAG TPA: type IV pilus modification protein PilV [Pseudoduganella sp.]
MHDATVAAADSAAATATACADVDAGAGATGAVAAAAAGFTLVEVLIATLVLALGLVGGVAMQLHAMRTRYESAQLSRAVHLAAGMAERIRANAAQTSLYVGFDYDSATDPHPPAFAPSAAAARTTGHAVAAAGPADPGAAPVACLAASCSPAELAGAELAELQRDVARQFATGRVRVCRDAQMWQARRLRWACTGGDTDPLVIKIGWRGKNPDGTPRTFGADDFAPGVAVAVASAVPPPAPSTPTPPSAQIAPSAPVPPSSLIAHSARVVPPAPLALSAYLPPSALIAPSAPGAPSALPRVATGPTGPAATPQTSTRSSGGPP